MNIELLDDDLLTSYISSLHKYLRVNPNRTRVAEFIEVILDEIVVPMSTDDLAFLMSVEAMPIFGMDARFDKRYLYVINAFTLEWLEEELLRIDEW
jgi:hypothetical protein